MQKGKTFENGYIASEEFPEYIEHFLYFPRSSDAEMAAEQLRVRGWSAKVELGADDRDWLAGLVRTAEEYPYSSAHQFFRGSLDPVPRRLEDVGVQIPFFRKRTRKNPAPNWAINAICR